MRKLFIIFLLAGSANAQWTPILGFQPDDSLGNFSYYTSDQNDAIEKCKEVLTLNNVNLETIDIERNNDPIINNDLRKEEHPGKIYLVYVTKNISGYVVRLKFFQDEYTEFEEDFVTIMYEGDMILKPSYQEILGNPVRIGDIEVSQYDFADGMNWTDASNECAKLGKGWRLPTYEELILMSRYRSNFDMDNATYWSCDINEIGTEAEVYNFSKTTSFYKSTTATNYVRAVRTYKKNRKE